MTSSNFAPVEQKWTHRIRHLYRWLSGDLAYEAYIAHWHSHHGDGEAQPLNRQEFFRERTIRRWRGINRCC